MLYSKEEYALVLAVAAFDGVEEFGGVVAYAVFEDDLYLFYVGDVGGGVAIDDDEVCVFAGGDRADLGLLTEVGGAVEGADLDGFDGGEAVGVDEELDLALVAEAGEGAAVAGGIGAAHGEAAGGYEVGLGFGAVLVGEGAFGIWRAGEFEVAGVEVSLARGRGHGF